MTSLDINPLSAQRGVDFDKLRTRFPALYKIAVRQTNHTTGIHALDLSLFQEGSHRYLSECAAPLPVQEPQIDLEAIEREEQAAIQKAAHEAEAKNRLNEYAAQGLEESDHNFNLIKEFVINSAVHGYWSSQIVDAAVANFGPRGTNRLKWKPKAAPAPPPEPEPVEPQEVLEPWQLPIDADERAMKASSVRALQDLIRRRRAATNQQAIRARVGEQRHGSSF
jgi:hypothetical protein